ncbi:MAG: dTDP-4-dehydrorhamnose 3,5-epimerase, partial [Thermodesulfobacteriota bacterium]
MKFIETSLPSVFHIELQLLKDERGHFARSYCTRAFSEHGLTPCLEQCNISFNQKKGTLRGMHFQIEPHAEAKLVRCVRGKIWDVVIDLRPGSKTFEQWIGIELAAQAPSMLYIPAGCAHGFQTLEDETEVFYQMSYPFVSEAARGIRWNDPYFNITWPKDKRIISAKDQNYPLYF